MPEIDPITREEKLWSGEDIEPITREEMYIKHIYDKTQKIPSKPITRKEMLLEKAGQGGGSDVTIKQLSVTANGTYSEENTAYSPVIVNVPTPPLSKLTVTENGTYTAPTGTGYDEVAVDVPLPSNAYLLKDIPNTPIDIATFTDGSALPMPKLKVAIEPQQEGSGDPSPENVRSISGHTEANVVVSPTTDAEDGTTYNIQFKDGDNPLTVYGGTLDVVSGELTVDRVSVDLGSPTWGYTNNRFYYKATNAKVYTQIEVANLLCSQYPNSQYNSQADNTISSYAGYIYVRADSYSGDVTAFKTAMNGVQLVYELATPQTYQLTPIQVKSLLGTNNVWADTGDIEELEYFSKEA